MVVARPDGLLCSHSILVVVSPELGPSATGLEITDAIDSINSAFVCSWGRHEPFRDFFGQALYQQSQFSSLRLRSLLFVSWPDPVVPASATSSTGGAMDKVESFIFNYWAIGTRTRCWAWTCRLLRGREDEDHQIFRSFGFSILVVLAAKFQKASGCNLGGIGTRW